MNAADFRRHQAELDRRDAAASLIYAFVVSCVSIAILSSVWGLV